LKSRKKKLNQWDWDNSIKNKLKKNDIQFPNNVILKDDNEKIIKNYDWVVGGGNWEIKFN
jgi:DNA/RNA-binding domain of Phe-tRNA-synthetase-like protein